jgi:hypothetical protein
MNKALTMEVDDVEYTLESKLLLRMSHGELLRDEISEKATYSNWN